MIPIVKPAPTFDTERLHLRPYASTDLDAMAEMFGDPVVTAHTYLGRQDRDGTAKILSTYMDFLEAHGYGMYAVLDRTTGAYLGEVGLFVSPMGPLALRYALNRAAWGHGYASEASGAIIDDTFGRLGLDELLAGVVEKNAPSLRVMDKLGFERRGTVTYGVEFVLFALGRVAWQRRRAAS